MTTTQNIRKSIAMNKSLGALKSKGNVFEMSLDEYVELTCRGGIYHGRDGEPDVFCGYMVNHGATGTIDSATAWKDNDPEKNQNIDDYILLPKKLVGQHPEMFVPCSGDSMINAGYEPTDLLRVRFGMEAQDGDSVLIYIDGDVTVKSLFTDEDGTKWLVPQNDKYNAIRLTEDMNVRILGIIVAVMKERVRASSRQMLHLLYVAGVI